MDRDLVVESLIQDGNWLAPWIVQHATSTIPIRICPCGYSKILIKWDSNGQLHVLIAWYRQCSQNAGRHQIQPPKNLHFIGQEYRLNFLHNDTRRAILFNFFFTLSFLLFLFLLFLFLFFLFLFFFVLFLSFLALSFPPPPERLHESW